MPPISSSAAPLRPTDYRAIGPFGEELQALGRQSDALRAFGQCFERLEAEVEAHPENADALAFGAAVLADLGRREQAEEWASWSLVLGEGQRLVHYNVGRTSLMLGRPEETLHQLERAFEASSVVRRRLALWMAHDEDLAPLAAHRRVLRLLADVDGRLPALDIGQDHSRAHDVAQPRTGVD